MCRNWVMAVRIAGLLALSGCASFLPDLASNVPPNRLSQYVGSQAAGKETPTEALPEVPVRAGLVLVADTTAPGAAPALPDTAWAQMAEALRDKLGTGLRLQVEQTLPDEGVRAGSDIGQFVAL